MNQSERATQLYLAAMNTLAQSGAFQMVRAGPAGDYIRAGDIAHSVVAIGEGASAQLQVETR